MSQTTPTLPVTIGLVQLSESIEWLQFLPYSAGLLEAYVKAYASEPRRYLFLMHIFRRAGLAHDLQALSLAQIVGFSVSIWNIEYSLALAQAIKQKNPASVIIFGGPQVPNHAEAFLRQYPFVDLCCHGEGEQTFLEVLEAFPSQDWQQIEGLSFLDLDGEYYQSNRARQKDLTRSASPFLAGVFEPLMLSYPEIKWMSIWETNRGCPFSCAFCDWGSATQSKVHRFPIARLLKEMQWFAQNKIYELFSSDANFGLLPRDLEITDALIQVKQKTGFPQVFTTQSTKNATDRAFEIQTRLYRSGMSSAATLALQTVTPAALTAVKRDNIDLASFQELQQRFRDEGVRTYTDVMVGLPGENWPSFSRSMGRIIEQGQHHELRAWNTYLLPNAPMADPAYRQAYQLDTVWIPYLRPYTAPDLQAEIEERQELLVGHREMSRADWALMRRFGWMTQILYFSKALQIAILLIHRLAEISIEKIMLSFFDVSDQLTLLSGINHFLSQKTTEILTGATDYCLGLGIGGSESVWMEVHYFVILELSRSPRLDSLYAESAEVLEQLLLSEQKHLPEGLLAEALALDQLIFYRQTHAGSQAHQISTKYNIWELYQQALRADTGLIKQGNWIYQ